ncbi:MAG: TetR/AcrR family transcriptional regulator [Pseudomonadota bacterium]
MKKTVLEGAMKAFTSKGYHAATIADVAEAAGLGKGTLYLYFKNKEAIAEAMVTAHFASVEAQFFAEDMPDSLDAFLDRLSNTMDVPDDHAGFIRVFFEVFGPSFASDTFAANVASFFDKLGAHYGEQLTYLMTRGEVRGDTDPKVAGRMLASLVDGIILHRGLFGIPKKRNTALRREAIAMFLKGLKAQAA